MNYFLSILLFFAVQPKWVKEIEQSIASINKNAVLETEIEKKDEDGKTIYKKYVTEKETKTNIQFQFGELMDFDVNFYENENQIFAEIISGQEVILQKGAKQKGDPYACLIEYRTYFKNKTEGLKMTRTLNIYENSDIEMLKKELKQMPFETEKIGEKEYQNLTEKHHRMVHFNE